MHDKINAREIIDRLMKISGLNQKEVAAQIFDISATNLSNRIKRNSIHISILTDWADVNNVNIGWILTGKGPVHAESIKKEEKSEKADRSEITIENAINKLKDIYSTKDPFLIQSIYANLIISQKMLHIEETINLGLTCLNNIERQLEELTRLCKKKISLSSNNAGRRQEDRGPLEGMKERRSGNDRRNFFF